MKRLAVVMAAVLLVGLLGLVIDAQSRVPVARPDQPGAPRMIFASGRVEGATPEIELRPQLAGRIQEVLVREGHLVEQGEVLLRLDDEQYRHEVELAEADLALANAELDRLMNGARPEEIDEAVALHHAKCAELDSAWLSLRRFDELLKSRAVSQQMVDDQRSLVATLTAQAEAAHARLEQLQAPPRREDVLMAEARAAAAAARLGLAKVQLGRTALQAPCRAQVLKAEVEPGELIGPDSPEPAIVLADTTRFRVRAFVEEGDAPRVQLGASCRITADGLPGPPFEGHIARLSPRMTAKQLWSDRPAERFDTKTREVWIELEEAAGLVVGLRVDVVIRPEVAKPDRTGSQTFDDPETSTPPPGPQPPAHAPSGKP